MRRRRTPSQRTAWYEEPVEDGLAHRLRRLRAVWGATLPEQERRRRELRRLAEAGTVSLGRCSYGAPAVLYAEEAHLRIGSFCSIGADVEIHLGGLHRPDWVTTSPLAVQHGWDAPHPFRSGGDVVVGNDVWIGRGARILSGVSIGDGAVVGAGSLVTRDVAPYDVVAGVPARVVRGRFDPAVRDALLRIRWWDWDLDRIEAAAATLCSPDLEEFVRRHDPGPA